MPKRNKIRSCGRNRCNLTFLREVGLDNSWHPHDSTKLTTLWVCEKCGNYQIVDGRRLG